MTPPAAPPGTRSPFRLAGIPDDRAAPVFRPARMRAAGSRIGSKIFPTATAGGELKTLFAAHPAAQAIVASLPHFSPYLWDLASSDAARLLAILKSDPDVHLASLVSTLAAQADALASESEMMRALRAMKAQAALLTALADSAGSGR